MKCPECGSENIIPIVYGISSDELLEDFNAEKVAIGGWCIREAIPTLRCKDCGHPFQYDNTGEEP